MSKHYLISNEGKWYKANLHSHSTDSDGALTPAQMKKAYMDKGYSVVAFSDHNVLVPHPELTDKNFVAITATEIDISDYRDMTVRHRPSYHLNFFAKNELCDKFVDFPKDEYKKNYSTKVINELVKKANEAGFLAQYNHPRWSQHTTVDYVTLEGFWGFEIINGATLRNELQGWGDIEYVTLIRNGQYPVTTASDDNHNVYPLENTAYCDSFIAFTMIKAKELTYKGIIEAMENRDVYGTNGPIIKSLYIEDNIVHIETEPANAIVFRTEDRTTWRVLADDDSLTNAKFDLSKLTVKPKFIRFEVGNTHGQKAMTRAYLPSEWED
ncbi:MAG: PHP domain-containing protein [Ruminococcaceae bacterium]|nr:PHP domain-containing protein [Oscillospiraceae bacterium]